MKKSRFSSTFEDSFQRDHQFCWDESTVFYLEVDLSSMSVLLQCPLGHERRFFSTKIGVEESFISCIGDETTTNLWLDHWLLDGQQFYDLFPFKMLTSIRLSWDAMFSASLRRVIEPFHLVVRSINLLGTQFIFTPRVPY